MNPKFIEQLRLVPAGNGWLSRDDPGEPGLQTPRWSINEIEGQILAELVKGYDVLEIGTGLGISTMFLFSTAKILWTFDIDPWVQDRVFPLLPKAIFTSKVFPDVSPGVRKFDAAFIDGFHEYQSVMEDIAKARKVVKDGGLLLFHDVNILGVKNAILSSGLGLIEIKTAAGMGMAWNNKE